MKQDLPLQWARHPDYHVEIDRRCIKKMSRLAAAHYPNEIGTPLVGHYSRDGQTAYVTSIGPVPSDSKSSRFSFVRGIVGLAEFFRGLGKRFRGKRYRVGEWHSHPEGLPDPSRTDDENQLALAKDKHEHLPEAILIIVGGHPTRRPSLGVFVYSRDRGRVDLTPK